MAGRSKIPTTTDYQYTSILDPRFFNSDLFEIHLDMEFAHFFLRAAELAGYSTVSSGPNFCFDGEELGVICPNAEFLLGYMFSMCSSQGEFEHLCTGLEECLFAGRTDASPLLRIKTILDPRKFSNHAFGFSCTDNELRCVHEAMLHVDYNRTMSEGKAGARTIFFADMRMFIKALASIVSSKQLSRFKQHMLDAMTVQDDALRLVVENTFTAYIDAKIAGGPEEDIERHLSFLLPPHSSKPIFKGILGRDFKNIEELLKLQQAREEEASSSLILNLWASVMLIAGLTAIITASIYLGFTAAGISLGLFGAGVVLVSGYTFFYEPAFETNEEDDALDTELTLSS